MSRAVRPYLVAPDSSVQFTGWFHETGAEHRELPTMLPDWDYNTDLQLRGHVTVDHTQVRAATLAEGPLGWCVSWRSLDGRVGGRALLSELSPHSTNTLEVRLPGSELGPQVEVSLRLILLTGVESPLPGAAYLPGSILWEHQHRLELAGTSARFPVSILDFRAAGLDPDASWVLELPDDLHTQVLGGLMLLINERDAELVAAASAGKSAGDPRIQALQEEVAVQLLDHAVLHAEDLTDESWPDGTLGATLAILARRSEGGLAVLAEMRESHPSAYRARLVGEARRNGQGRMLP